MGPFPETAMASALTSLLHFTLPHYPPIRLPRVLIGRLGVLHLCGADELLLLRPALIHALQAPLGAASAGADQLAADEDEDGVRVRGGQDSQRHPTAARDRDIESHVPD